MLVPENRFTCRCPAGRNDKGEPPPQTMLQPDPEKVFTAQLSTNEGDMFAQKKFRHCCPDETKTTRSGGKLMTLPDEVLARIFDMLPRRDLARMALVCREWRDCENVGFWEVLCALNGKGSCPH